MKYIINGDLQDKRIANALRQAAEDYENGELLEDRDLLLEIIAAINEFEDTQE